MSYVSLGPASPFAVLAGTIITNTGPTVISGIMACGSHIIDSNAGQVGISPGATAPSGFPPGTISGTQHIGDATALAAQTYISAVALPLLNAQGPGTTITGGNLTGLTLSPGVYTVPAAGSNLTVGGNLTLSAGSAGNNAVWIFLFPSTFITSSASSVTFLGGIGCECRVYWVVRSSATIATTSDILGNIIATTSIGMFTGATLDGRAIAQSGAVTLQANTITNSSTVTCTGGDPHVICLDGSRIDVYDEGYYRLYSNGDIMINAEIRRNPETHFDYYNQLWIKLGNTSTYLVNFTENGLEITDQNDQKHNETSGIWKQSYTCPDGNHYVFNCESKYNTISLSTFDANISCSGLMAGQIIPLINLEDELITPPCSLKSNYYNRNALVAGSAGPHIITTQKNSLRVSSNWFRLLQWATEKSSAVINVQIDAEGQLRQMVCCSEQNGQLSMDSWKWTGEQHWNLLPFKNGLVLNQHSIEEFNFDLGNGDEILLRTQGNGSLSASFKGVNSTVRGLLTDDVLIVSGPYDLKMYEVNCPVSKDLDIMSGLSLYQRIIDPMAV